MQITRHISLKDDYIEKLKPYVERHDGNFAAAIRDMIHQAGKRDTKINSSIIDLSLFNWILKEIDGKLLPGDILDEFINPMMINSMDKLEGYLNNRFSELKWDIRLAIKYNDMSPGEVFLEIKGDNSKLKFIACMVSQYLVRNSLSHVPLEVKYVINSPEGIKVEFSGSNKINSLKSLEIFFAKTDELIRIIKSRPDFWKSTINRHLISNYNMVTVHRNYYEDLLAGKIPAGEITIENLARKPLHEIPLNDMLILIKEVFETSRIVDRVEIDKDKLIIFHNYRNREAIDTLKKSIAALLEANGHTYDAKSTNNIMILTHRSEIDIKINEIVDSLKKSNNKLDQELLIFLGFIMGLNDIPDIPLSLTFLGRRIGKSLMQEYEKENEITKWDLEIFQKALQKIDSRLHRESEWKFDGKNLLYTIRKCNIVGNKNTFDKYVCKTVRETFKGALNYAFGKKAEMNIQHLLTHGDNFCEVVIRIP